MTSVLSDDTSDDGQETARDTTTKKPAKKIPISTALYQHSVGTDLESVQTI